MLLNYHIGRLVLSSLCVGDLVRLVLGGVRFAGWSTYFLCAQNVSDSNISIIRSLRLCWFTTSVVLFSVRCVLEFWCGWFWVVFVLQAEAHASYVLKMFRTLIYSSSGACDCVVDLPHRSSCSQFVVCWSFGAAGFGWYPFCRLKHMLLMCSKCFGH